MNRRIGIFGGTFDPPHRGHVLPLAHVARQFYLDRIYFVPAFRSPHKLNHRTASPYHRVAMLALAIRKYPNFLVSTFELSQRKVVYTIDTLQYFSGTLHPGDQLFFILGADSFLELGTWKEPARLLQFTDFIIINRGVKRQELNRSLEQLEQRFHLDLRKRIHISSSHHLRVSSSEIRNALVQGQSVLKALAPDVEAYIRKHSLYTEVSTHRNSK